MPEQTVVLRVVPEIRGLGVREKVAGPAGIGDLLSDGLAGLGRIGVLIEGAAAAVYHDPQFRADSIDLEIVLPVPAWVKAPVATPAGRVLEKRRVPGGEVVSVTHHGSYRTIGESYQMLSDWIREYGYRVSGPPCELYLSLPAAPKPPVTEIRLPVEKAGG